MQPLKRGSRATQAQIMEWSISRMVRAEIPISCSTTEETCCPNAPMLIHHFLSLIWTGIKFRLAKVLSLFTLKQSIIDRMDLAEMDISCMIMVAIEALGELKTLRATLWMVCALMKWILIILKIAIWHQSQTSLAFWRKRDSKTHSRSTIFTLTQQHLVGIVLLYLIPKLTIFTTHQIEITIVVQSLMEAKREAWALLHTE